MRYIINVVLMKSQHNNGTANLLRARKYKVVISLTQVYPCERRQEPENTLSHTWNVDRGVKAQIYGAGL